MKRNLIVFILILLCHSLFGQTDYDNYVNWLSKANAGDAKFQHNIGWCYYNGRGVNQDYCEAFKWYTKAAAQDYHKSIYAIGNMYWKGQFVKYDRCKAFEYYLKAAKLGNANAQYKAGFCWEYGNSAGLCNLPDQYKAEDWYQKAAAQGNESAKAALERLGIVVTPVVNALATIDFKSSTTSSTISYNLRAAVKSNSKITDVSVTTSNSRGIIPINNDGYDFTINRNLTLNYGNNTITVSVTNGSGTTSKSFDVYVSGSPVLNVEKRVALVVGNNNYKNAPLKTPVNDANDIAAMLRSFNFDVTLKTNLTAYEFKNALSLFKNKASNSDVALFYYAGHGMEVNQTNFLFPIDVESFCDGTNGVDASINVLNAVAGATKKIIIIDACRNNPCRNVPGFKRMSASNAFIAYSASEGRLANDIGSNGRNSPYAEALLYALRYKSSLSLPQLFQSINNSVSTGQLPTYTSSLIGDFIFKK